MTTPQPKTRQQVADTVEALIWSQLSGDRRRLLAQLDQLLRGPKWDSYAVTATLAAAVAEGWTLEPGETFHRVRVSVLEPDGTKTEGSADDLIPPVRLFAQMCAAIANGDPELGRDLFIGYVGEHALRAQQVIRFGLQTYVANALPRQLRKAAGDG